MARPAITTHLPVRERTLAEVDGTRRHFIHDGANVRRRWTTAVRWSGVTAPALGRSSAGVDDGNELRWLLSDHNGSVRDVVDNDGQSLAHFAYTPFGEQILGPAPTMDDPVRFTGREFDVPGAWFLPSENYRPASLVPVSEDPSSPGTTATPKTIRCDTAIRLARPPRWVSL